jgi:hypothetical protein
MAFELEREEDEYEREQARLFIEFLIHVYSQRPQGKEDGQFIQERKNFIESIKPQKKRKQREPDQPKIYNWDEEMLKRLKSKQAGGD